MVQSNLSTSPSGLDTAALARCIDACWKWLPVFVHVAETENVARTARALYTTGPSISKAVKHIETALGQQLFDRVSGRIRLNANGRALLSVARPALRMVSEELGRLSLPLSQITVATTPSVSVWFQGELLRELRMMLPNCRFSTRTGVARELYDNFEANQIDLFLHTNCDRLGDSPQVLFESSLRVYSAPDHPLVVCDELTEEDLVAYPFAVHEPLENLCFWPEDAPLRELGCFSDSLPVLVEATKGSNLLLVADETSMRGFFGELLPLRAKLSRNLKVFAQQNPHSPAAATIRTVLEELRINSCGAQDVPLRRKFRAHPVMSAAT